MSKMYQQFEVPDELQNNALEALELARDTGKIKRDLMKQRRAIDVVSLRCTDRRRCRA